MGNKTKSRSVSWRGRLWIIPANGTPNIQSLSAMSRTYGYTRIASDVVDRRLKIRKCINASGNMLVDVSNAEVVDLRSVVNYRQSAVPSSPDFGKMGSYGVDGVHFNVNLPLGITSHTGSSSMLKAREIAIRSLQRGWTKRRRQFQGIVFAGELGKAVKMVLRPAKALRASTTRFIFRLGKLRKRTTPRHSFPKAVADTWLETVFGWSPLIADLKDGFTAVARVAEKEALARQQFRYFGMDEVPVSHTEFGVGPVGMGLGDNTYFRVNKTVSHASQCILYGIWSSRLQDAAGVASRASELARLSGLNWNDVPAQIWELIPYSFLVDYFTNIGDMIEGACNLTDGPSWVEEVTIVESKDSREFTLDLAQIKTFLAGKYVSSFCASAPMQQSYKSVSRHAYLESLTLDHMRLQIPGGMQWINISALVAGGRPVQTFLKS